MCKAPALTADGLCMLDVRRGLWSRWMIRIGDNDSLSPGDIACRLLPRPYKRYRLLYIVLRSPTKIRVHCRKRRNGPVCCWITLFPASALQCVMQQNGPFVRWRGWWECTARCLSPCDLDLWPLALTFKFFRARGQTRLPCEFGANLFSGSRDKQSALLSFKDTYDTLYLTLPANGMWQRSASGEVTVGLASLCSANSHRSSASAVSTI